MDEKREEAPTKSSKVPTWLKRWLGLHTLSSPPPTYALYLWPFIGSFGALAVLQAVFGHSWYFISRGSPALVTSYGASVVLCFDKIESPLAQPPALVGGHFISGLIGIIISKILYGSSTLEEGDADLQYQWVGASFATAFAMLAMQLTRTTHPPAGATALLPILDKTVNKLSWYFLPILLLHSTLVLALALLINNIQRRYPVTWFMFSLKKPACLEKKPAAQQAAAAASSSSSSSKQATGGLPELGQSGSSSTSSSGPSSSSTVRPGDLEAGLQGEEAKS